MEDNMMMVETRMLGISPVTKGLSYIEQMIKGRVIEKDLSDRQIEDVIYSWETRRFISNDAYEGPQIPSENIVPNSAKTLEEGQIRQKDYNRMYVRDIAKNLKTISYMVNVLGLPLGTKGSYYIEQMLIGKISNKEIKDDDLQEVIEAWKERNCDKDRSFGPSIEEDKIVSNSTHILQHGQMRECEYNRRCVEDIERYLKEKC